MTETNGQKKNIIKHDAKDSVFHDLFSQPEYLLQLYRSLHPEDKETTEKDLSLVTLQSIIIPKIYNDLGFEVKNKLIILVEAQSTWSVNIVIRALIYLMNSYQEYLNNVRANIYSSKKIELPKPELYVVYTKEKNGHPDKISFREEYFPNEECCIEAEVRVIYEDDSKSIISQYVGFCKKLDDCLKKYGRTQKAIEETLKICEKEDLLKEYLQTRETEVKGIMLTLFSQERATELYGMEMREEGIGIGRAEGIGIGRAEGIGIGRAEGIGIGRAEGIGIGRAEGIGIGRAEGIGIGRAEGIGIGIIDTYLSLIQDNFISKEVAIEKLGISATELEEKLKAYKKTGSGINIQR